MLVNQQNCKVLQVKMRANFKNNEANKKIFEKIEKFFELF
jgi:hypothetical protein